MRRRRIAVVTGTRSEFGVLRSVLTAIAAQPGLELQLAVTGMHLLRGFGYTAAEIARDGWKIDARVPMQAGGDDPLDQARGLARGVAGLARYFERAHADVVLVLGDRIEAMAGALAAVTTGRILAHVHGGDVAPGDFDEGLRHAITKLAHLHFAATRRSAQRILRMGEPRRHVFCVGGPGLDRLRELIVEAGPRKRASGLALVLFHASGRPAAVERRAMDAVLGGVAATGLRRRIIYPNTDRGYRGVLAAIARHARAARGGAVSVVRSLPRDAFLRALLEADVIVGNSSSGIIEAPLAGTPSVDVGARQRGREAGGPSVIHCAERPTDVAAAVRRALRLPRRRGGRSVYGDGRAGQRIAQLLARIAANDALRKKRITY